MESLKLPVSCTLDPALVAYRELDLTPYQWVESQYVTHLANQLAVVAEFSGGLDPENVHKSFLQTPASHLVHFEEKAKGEQQGIRYFKVRFVPLNNPWRDWWICLRQSNHRVGEIVNICHPFTADPISPLLLTQLLIQAGRIVERWALEHQQRYEAVYLKKDQEK